MNLKNNIPSMQFYWYGLFYLLAVIIGYWFYRITQLSHRFNLSSSDLENLFLLAFPLALAGARFYHVLSAITYYQAHPVEIFYFWQGGLGFYGALLGIVLAVWIYNHLQLTDTLKILNCLAFYLPLGQAIGRLGNVINSELLPYAYFEIILNLLIFTWLNLRKPQQTFVAYLLFYGLGRFFLEFTRSDGVYLSGLSHNQWVSLLLAAIGMYWLMGRFVLNSRSW